MLPAPLLALALLASPALADLTLPNGHQFLARPHSRPLPDTAYIPFSRRSVKGVSGRQRRAAYATVRCDSLYTWSLCDGADKCTDMGSVAPGTACIDGAMAFDPNGSQGATSGATNDSTGSSSDASDSSTSASTSSSEDSSSSSLAAAPTVVINAAIQKPATTAAASTTSRRRKHRKTSTSSKPAAAITTTARKAAASAATVIAAAQQDPLSSAVSSVSSTVSDLITGGFATFFYQMGGYGACGKVHPDSDFIVALALARYGTGSNNAPDCGRRLKITNTDNGKSVEAVVADACPGCRNYNSLDLSIATFDAIAEQATGVVPIEWAFLD